MQKPRVIASLPALPVPRRSGAAQCPTLSACATGLRHRQRHTTVGGGGGGGLGEPRHLLGWQVRLIHTGDPETASSGASNEMVELTLRPLRAVGEPPVLPPVKAEPLPSSLLCRFRVVREWCAAPSAWVAACILEPPGLRVEPMV